MGFNITMIKTSSDGVWQGDNPLNYAFPLLILQTTLVLFTSRCLAFLLKPLRQPKVVAEIIGGILLGPSALGRNEEFLQLVFPSWSTPILESVASIGLLFFLFLVGLELDLSSIRRSGRKAFTIAVVGISIPFIFGAGVSFFLRKAIVDEHQYPRHHDVGYAQFLVFMGVALSITAFPVLARILAELKLLTTHVGQTAMAAAAFNDVAAWILLALTVALAGNGTGEYKSPLISVWVLLSGVAFVVFMMVFIRPAMKWVAWHCSPEHEALSEACICLTLAGVMVSGFITDFIGIHSIFGAFIFGLTIPKGGIFGERLIERLEDFVSSLLLPLYFASSGLKTNVGRIHGAEAWGILVMVISVACTGKILGTFVASMMCQIPARESLALGVLMNTKGLVELIVLNIGKEKKVLNDEMFAILVLMALATTFMTTPIIMIIYKPSHRQNFLSPRQLKGKEPLADDLKEELRILVCLHGPGNVPSIIELIEPFHTTNTSLKLYVMHLVELTDRPSSIAMVHRARRNGVPFVNRLTKGKSRDQIASAFEAYGQIGKVSIRHTKGISALTTMHEDICHVAEDKRVAMIILPFHKQGRGEEEGKMECVGNRWRVVNQRVLTNAHCSVAVLVDHGFGRRSSHVTEDGTGGIVKRVGIVFFGGPDDIEALEVGRRMGEHPTTKVTLLHFVEKGNSTAQSEEEMDGVAVAEFRKRYGFVEYERKVIDENLRQVIMEIEKSKEYELLILGKGPKSISKIVEKLADNQTEYQGLGPIGNILASSDCGVLSSALVIQKYNQAEARMDEESNV